MLVKELMTRGVEGTRPNATLQEAAQAMRDLDVGPSTVRVRDVMTPEVIYCFEDQDIAKAGQLMRKKQVRRLVVLNRDKRLVGMLSLDDLAVRTGDEMVSGNTLEGVAWPAVP
jgi:CBS domain-containing protein